MGDVFRFELKRNFLPWYRQQLVLLALETDRTESLKLKLVKECGIQYKRILLLRMN